MTAQDRRQFLWGNLFLLGINVLAIGCMWWVTVDIQTALEDIRNEASHVIVPVGTFCIYLWPGLLVGHVLVLFFNRWSPPRPRLQRVMIVAMFVVAFSGAFVGWLIDRHVLATAERAGYQRCFDTIRRTQRAYAIDLRDCPNTRMFEKRQR